MGQREQDAYGHRPEGKPKNSNNGSTGGKRTVKEHTRETPKGKKTRVKEHTRPSQGSKKKPNSNGNRRPSGGSGRRPSSGSSRKKTSAVHPSRAKRNARKAIKLRKRNGRKAIGFGLLALGQVAAYLLIQTTVFLIGAFFTLLFVAAIVIDDLTSDD